MPAARTIASAVVRGCASGESGTPNASTQLAPIEAISHGVPDRLLSQPVAPMAMTTPMNDVSVKRSEGAAGAPDLSRRGVGMVVLAIREMAQKDTDRYP